MFLFTFSIFTSFISLGTLLAGVALLVKYNYTVCTIVETSIESPTILKLKVLCNRREFFVNVTSAPDYTICLDSRGNFVMACDTFAHQMGLIFICLGSTIFLSCVFLCTRECLRVYTESYRDDTPVTLLHDSDNQRQTTISTQEQDFTIVEIDANSEIILAVNDKKQLAYVIEQPGGGHVKNDDNLRKRQTL